MSCEELLLVKLTITIFVELAALNSAVRSKDLRLSLLLGNYL